MTTADDDQRDKLGAPPIMSDIERGARIADEMHRATILTLTERLAAAERRAEEAESMFRDYALAAQTIGFESSAAGIEDPDGTLVGIYRNTLTALASERAARESWEREFNVANAERIRLHNEAENFSERLGQFEAAGFPNVATVLDRIEAERAAREKAEFRLRETEGWHKAAVRERDLMREQMNEILGYEDIETPGPDEDVASVVLAAMDHLRWQREQAVVAREKAEREFLAAVFERDDEKLKTAHAEARVARLEADLEQARVQLAGCGVVALCNTGDGLAKAMPEPGSYGYSASLADVERRRLEPAAPVLAALVRAIVRERGRCFIPTNDPTAPDLLDWDERAQKALAALAEVGK